MHIIQNVFILSSKIPLTKEEFNQRIQNHPHGWTGMEGYDGLTGNMASTSHFCQAGSQNWER